MRLIMTQFTVSFTIVITLCASASAVEKKFPYEAVVDANEARLRSGPGRKYYVTSKLQQGQRVQVFRHDPGGWYMIAPPEGSFSWIRADAVETKDGQNGVVQRNNVSVQVGSQLGDQHEVEQRRLSKGDVVQILEEVDVRTPNGPDVMYKIAPPTGEYRWIPGRVVTPVDPQLRATQDRDPFTVPSHIRRHKLADNSKSPDQTVSPGQQSDNQLTAEQQFRELDSQFQTAVAQNQPDQWPLDQFIAGYQSLQQRSGAKPLHGQIRQRLAALSQYKKIQDEYTHFLALSNATSQRDAQLSQMQHPRTYQPGVTRIGQSVPGQQQSVVTQQPLPDPRATRVQRIPESGGFAPGGSLPNGPALQQNAAQQAPIALSGAGIIQQAIDADGQNPQFVLLSQEGRILAFLQSGQGIDLAQYIGQPMGIQGTRNFNQELQADLIIVTGLIPVQLQ